jgi:L-alanine-DL-glutamate epimerase-like enolase superfamily enzyme
MDRPSDVGELSHFTDLPLAGGETLGGLGQIRELIEVGRIGTPIVDVTWGGGLTFGRKAAALAEAHGKPIAFHDCSGPVTLTASTHLAMACPNVAEQEIARGFYYGWYGQCVTQLPPIENGFIRVPSGAGLGVELDEGMVKRLDTAVRTSTNLS